MFVLSLKPLKKLKANWNGQAGRQTGAQDYVLSQAEALTKNVVLCRCHFGSVLDSEQN